MRDVRNPTVFVPPTDDLDPVFHSTNRCSRLPYPIETQTRSAARRQGLTECVACYEHRRRSQERALAVSLEPPADSAVSASSTSGFSDFAVE
jgi:hypothetical protein